jgi:uroporphyrinogen-III synthase
VILPITEPLTKAPKIQIIMTRTQNATDAFLTDWAFAQNNQDVEFLSFPLFEKQFLNQDRLISQLQDASFDALLLTSQNAVKAMFELQDHVKDMSHINHIFCVGSETYKAVQSFGVENAQLHNADGAVQDLIQMLNKRPEMKILFPSGDVLAEGTEELIDDSHHHIERLPVYQMRPLDAHEFLAFLESQENVDIARIFTFFSPNSAKNFVSICKNINFNQYVAVCISENTANHLVSSDWKNIIVSEHPSRDAVRGEIEKACVRLL